MEIGVDIVDISELSRIIDNMSILKKIFTEKEIEYCNNKESREQHYAARFAAKEALIKALNAYGDKILLNNIEIENNDEGRPTMRLIDEKINKKYTIKLSLSHSPTSAIATVITLKTDMK